MKSRALRYAAIILVNVSILAAIEVGSGLFIRKHFKKADETFRRDALVDHPFALPAGYKMRANATIVDSKSTTRIRTDDRGHAIVPDALPSPRCNLAILGGSAMFGTGVTDNASTVPAQLQTVLRQDYGLEVNVINLSARGYVSLQELLVLNEYLAERPVEMVVSVSGYNDLMRYLSGDPNPTSIKRSEAEALVRRVEAGHLVVVNVVPSLRRLSQTANLLALVIERRQERVRERRKLAAETQNVPKKDRDSVPAGPNTASASPAVKSGRDAPKNAASTSASTFLSAHLAHYAMMHALCEVHHTYFKMCFQPSAFTKVHLSDEERSRLLLKDFAGSQQELDRRILSHTEYRAGFDAMPKTFPFTDLADAFGQAEGALYLDGCHYNEEGAMLLARVIAADLAPIIQSRLAERHSPP